jgi:hypothetical protein
MSSTDLTRWNRAGLPRFRYIEGNAATFLDLIRQHLHTAFPGWADVAPPPTPAADQQAELERLLAQYTAERRDLLWEIVRTFARSCYVLTEHIDAYANEGHLRTATEWDNVRKLVALLDYTPAPPASAGTRIALLAPEGATGTLPRGFQIQHVPPDGGAPIVFETLDDTDVDGSLTALRLRDHDRALDAVDGDRLVLAGVFDDLTAGDPVVIEDEATGTTRAHLIRDVDVSTPTSTIRLTRALAPGLTRGRTVVHAGPVERLRVLGPVESDLVGFGHVLPLEAPPTGLAAGSVLHITDGTGTCYRRLVAVRGSELLFDTELIPLRSDRAFVSRSRQVPLLKAGAPQGGTVQTEAVGDLSALAGSLVAELRSTGALAEYTITSADFVPVDPQHPGAGGMTTLLLALAAGDHGPADLQELLVPPSGRDFAVDAVLPRPAGQPLPPSLRISRPRQAGPGQPVVVIDRASLAWGRATGVALDPQQDAATLQVPNWQADGPGGPFRRAASTVCTAFRHRARLAGWQDNDTPVTGSSLALDTVPAALVRGRVLLLEPDEPGGPGRATLVTTVDVDRPTGQLAVAPPIDSAAGLTIGHTVLRGNVVRAGHGARRPERVLGSGDATQAGQSFVLRETGASFVPDPAGSSGVRADIEVVVDGQVWQQVSTLRESGPFDPHYQVRLTEDGQLITRFGDGQHGRRVPTGTNNVRIRYRVGSGLAGLLPPGSLTQPVRPHRLLDGIRQPLPATGGNAVESTESMRRLAPASVLALDRAVSLNDFAALAAAHSSVWQARARRRRPGIAREESIEVVVVPAGGGELGDLSGVLRTYLLARCPAGIDIAISRYQPVPLSLEVSVQIDRGAFDPVDVTARVRATLLDALGVRVRGLGADLYLSEVVAAVEGIRGVQNSRCVIDGDPTLRRRTAQLNQVILLDGDKRLHIDVEEGRP